MSPIRFQSTPYSINERLVLRLPPAASAQLPSRGQVMVAGTIEGFPFQVPLEPDGKGSHWLEIDEAMQAATGINTGDTARLEIEPTKVWPEPAVPADWQKALAADPEARSLWNAITPMARHEWLRWIGSTSQSETRRRRIEVSCSKLRAGSRRPCCFNRNVCCVPDVSKNGVLLEPAVVA